MLLVSSPSPCPNVTLVRHGLEKGGGGEGGKWGMWKRAGKEPGGLVKKKESKVDETFLLA